MYYDIVYRQYTDENGMLVVEPIPVTVPPADDGVTPEDMSLDNQLKAGAQLKQVQAKSGSKLLNADSAERSLFMNGDNIVFNDPTPSDPTPSDPTPSDPTPSDLK